MAVKMKTINSEGKEIIKDIEDDLYSQYIMMGWKEVKEVKPINFSKGSKEQPKEEKINDKNL